MHILLAHMIPITIPCSKRLKPADLMVNSSWSRSASESDFGQTTALDAAERAQLLVANVSPVSNCLHCTLFFLRHTEHSGGAK